jgi:hypothetical protein
MREMAVRYRQYPTVGKEKVFWTRGKESKEPGLILLLSTCNATSRGDGSDKDIAKIRNGFIDLSTIYVKKNNFFYRLKMVLPYDNY